MDTAIQTLSTIVLASNLSHLVIFTNGYRGLLNPEVPIMDFDCSEMFSSFYKIVQNKGFIVNIAVNCQDVYPKGTPPLYSNISMREETYDPLAKPMINLIIVGDITSHNQLLLDEFGKMAMIKEAFTISLRGQSGQSCAQGTLRTTSGDEVAEVSSSCDYLGHPSRLSDAFTGFRGRIFIVATRIAKYFDQLQDNRTKKWTGYTIDILDGLSHALDFKYELITPEDGQFGININGTWTGVMGIRQRKEADMIVSSLTVTSDRSELVSFTQFYRPDSVKVFIVIQEGTGSKFRFSVKDVRWSIWIILTFIILIVAGLIYSGHLVVGERQDTPLIGWIFNILGVLFNQGVTSKIMLASTRILTSATLIMVILFMASYSGTLIAKFSNRKVEPPFTTIKGLVKDNTYILLASEGSLSYHFLKNSRDGLHRQLFERIDRFGDDNDFVQMARQGTRAAIINVQYGDIIYETEGVCNTYVLGSFLPSGSAVAMPKNSPYIEVFSMKIRQMFEHALLAKWEARNRPRSQCEPVEQKSVGPQSISLEDVSNVFIFLLMALVIDAFVFAMEKLPAILPSPRMKTQEA